jgi:hypothetical protein
VREVDSTALKLVGTVESIEIDEESDTAKVVLSGDAQRTAVDAALSLSGSIFAQYP